MRLAFRHWTADQLHVLSLTFTEVVTTYLTFRFEFGHLAWNFKRASFAFCGFLHPLRNWHRLAALLLMPWEIDIRPYWGYFVSHQKDAKGVGSSYTPERINGVLSFQS